MRIFINHSELEVPDGCTLAEALAAAGLDRPGLAVAMGYKVIKKDDRAATVLGPDAEITVIKAVCGG